ncbi:MAG: ParD-like family protein [Luteimonas sp.]|nr:ParD-like family protein [Luteimonas sp.]
MAKNVRISDELYALAQMESRLQDRSIAQQLEHWAKRGIAAVGSLGAGHRTVSAVDAAVAMTRRLDELEVLSGRRSADATHLISRSAARQSKRVFHGKYQKS